MKANPTKSKARINPFLRWAGGKRQILPALETFWKPAHRRYVEPFAGSACLFFRLQPKDALLGDINKELIATYVEVKYRVASVVEELAKLKKGRTNYLRLRTLDVNNLSAAKRAARFIYLNRFCFNGLYRTNLKGEFNVPYGGEKSGEIPSEDALRSCSRLLKTAKLVSGDFEKVLNKVEEGDFVYMDPPFSVEAKRVFKEYNSSIFSNSDLIRLRRWLELFARRKVDFLVSYAECDEADYLKKDFFYRTISVRRNIAGFSAQRCFSKEVLISSSPISI